MLTCNVHKVLPKLQDTLSVVICQYDHSKRKQVSYSWRLVPWKACFCNGVVHITVHQRATQTEERREATSFFNLY